MSWPELVSVLPDPITGRLPDGPGTPMASVLQVLLPAVRQPTWTRPVVPGPPVPTGLVVAGLPGARSLAATFGVTQVHRGLFVDPPGLLPVPAVRSALTVALAVTAARQFARDARAVVPDPTSSTVVDALRR